MQEFATPAIEVVLQAAVGVQAGSEVLQGDVIMQDLTLLPSRPRLLGDTRLAVTARRVWTKGDNGGLIQLSHSPGCCRARIGDVLRHLPEQGQWVNDASDGIEPEAMPSSSPSYIWPYNTR